LIEEVEGCFVPKITHTVKEMNLSKRGRERSISLGKVKSEGREREASVKSVFDMLCLDAVRREKQKIENEIRARSYDASLDMTNLKNQKQITALMQDGKIVATYRNGIKTPYECTPTRHLMQEKMVTQFDSKL
jgi:hypothetical protein